MPKISHWFFRAAVLFLIVGIGIGLLMAISQDHTVAGAHAHINLLGWVTSAIFGGYYALNPAKAEGSLPLAHFAAYTVGVLVMVVSLYFLLQGNVALGPLVVVGAIVAFIGVLIFAVVVFSKAPEGSARAVPAE